MEGGEQPQTPSIRDRLPPTHKIRSSVFYYFLLQIMWLWNLIDTVVLIVLQSMKLYQFPAPQAARNFAMVAPFLLCLFYCIRLWMATPGNRSEKWLLLLLSLLFMIGCVLMDIYFIIWQPYLWKWEFPFHIVSIVFEVIYFLFTCLMIIVFLAKK